MVTRSDMAVPHPATSRALPRYGLGSFALAGGLPTMRAVIRNCSPMPLWWKAGMGMTGSRQPDGRNVRWRS